jgi:hypothetical protein
VASDCRLVLPDEALRLGVGAGVTCRSRIAHFYLASDITNILEYLMHFVDKKEAVLRQATITGGGGGWGGVERLTSVNTGGHSPNLPSNRLLLLVALSLQEHTYTGTRLVLMHNAMMTLPSTRTNIAQKPRLQTQLRKVVRAGGCVGKPLVHHLRLMSLCSEVAWHGSSFPA